MPSMDSALPSIQDIQKSLEPYIKPRDQVSYIRRVLALHLESCLDNGGLQNPLSLVDSSCTTTAGHDSRGLQREYLRALETNYKARREHSRVKQQHIISEPLLSSTSASVTDPIEDHIGAIKLHEKEKRLLVIQKYLDHLGREPAAALDFLDPHLIFQGSRRLPEIPKEVVQGFAVDTISVKTDLKAVVSQLDKVVLRAKILLQSEERQLDEVRRKASSLQSHNISLGVKLQALNTTRTELINWIETELGKASPDSEGADSEDGAQQSADDNRDTLGRKLHPVISNKLTDIKAKYNEYVKARGSLLDLSRHDPGVSLEPPVQFATESAHIKMEQGTTTYLLTPYLENLLAVSREQKASISQKSHFNITLAKQMKETCHMLDRLAEESQLLPGHAAPGASRPKFGLNDDLGLGASEQPESSGRVKAWVSAADAAKMATLEAVAEKLEEGQVALEGCMGFLHEVERLLGQNSDDQAEASSEEEEDVWLAEARPSKKPTHSRKLAGGTGRKTKKQSDVWSVLQGNLGLTHHGASA